MFIESAKVSELEYNTGELLSRLSNLLVEPVAHHFTSTDAAELYALAAPASFPLENGVARPTDFAFTCQTHAP